MTLFRSLLISKTETNTYVLTYSTAFNSFLTFLYVLITYLILNSTIKSNNEQLRPYVIVTFPVIHLQVYFIIKNIGHRPAYNVTIEIDPALDTLQEENLKGNCTPMLFQNFIAPSQEFKNSFTTTLSVLSSKRKEMLKCFNISIKYSDSIGNEYSEKQKIDFNTFTYERKIINRDTDDYLKGIETQLKKISDALTKEE